MRILQGSGVAALTVMILAGQAAAGAQEAHPRSTRLPPPAPFAGPYDVKGLGLGTERTIIVTFAAEKCAPCVDGIAFYKSLLKLPGMDNQRRRLIVVATDGVWPVQDVIEKHGFEPHRLTSGPYPARKIPGVTKTPTLLILDKSGATVGKWEGALSRAQQQEVVAAMTKGGATRKE